MSSGFPSAGGRGGSGGFGSRGNRGSSGDERGDRGERGGRGGRGGRAGRSDRAGGGTFRGSRDLLFYRNQRQRGEGLDTGRAGGNDPECDEYRDRRADGQDAESRDRRRLRSKSPNYRHREERRATGGSEFDTVLAIFDREQEERREERIQPERLRSERPRSPPRGPRHQSYYANKPHHSYSPVPSQAPSPFTRSSLQWINPERGNSSSSTAAASPSSQVTKPVTEEKKMPKFAIPGRKLPRPKPFVPWQTKETVRQESQDQRLQKVELELQQLRQENKELKARNLEMQRLQQQRDDVPEDSNPDSMALVLFRGPS